MSLAASTVRPRRSSAAFCRLGFFPAATAIVCSWWEKRQGTSKRRPVAGIYYGMLTGEIAAEALAAGLQRDRLDSGSLSVYEKRWRDLLEAEIETGLKLRRSFKLINDWGVERLMDLARRDGLARLIREKADFDWHQELIRAVFRHATVGRILGAA